MGSGGTVGTATRIEGWIEQEVIRPLDDFHDPKQEWRRLFSELLGTFFLVLVAAGGGMMGRVFPNDVPHIAAVVAPGLMVLAIILFMGKVSGAHLNPAVSIGFSLRGDFPWHRVPGYVVVQLVGAALGAWFLQSVVQVSAVYGSNYPASSYSTLDAFWMETVLTFGLLSVILGTASGAQNVGLFGAIGVGAYIALAGMWGSGISGASTPRAHSVPISWARTSPITGCTWPDRSSGCCSRWERPGCFEVTVVAGPDQPAPRAGSARRSSTRTTRNLALAVWTGGRQPPCDGTGRQSVELIRERDAPRALAGHMLCREGGGCSREAVSCRARGCMTPSDRPTR